MKSEATKLSFEELAMLAERVNRAIGATVGENIGAVVVLYDFETRTAVLASDGDPAATAGLLEVIARATRQGERARVIDPKTLS